MMANKAAASSPSQPRLRCHTTNTTTAPNAATAEGARNQASLAPSAARGCSSR